MLDIIEFFMGSDPTKAETEFVIRGQRVGDDFKMYFPMRTDHGLNYTAEASADLANWSGAEVVIQPRPDLGSSTAWSMMEASVPAHRASMLFLRLQVQGTDQGGANSSK